MPRKVDPSELSAVSRQILSRMSDPPVDLNDLWEVPAPECEDLLQEDRKSTRLNSSHLVISYAVFCLKKKKIDLSGGTIQRAVVSGIPGQLIELSAGASPRLASRSTRCEFIAMCEVHIVRQIVLVTG